MRTASLRLEPTYGDAAYDREHTGTRMYAYNLVTSFHLILLSLILAMEDHDFNEITQQPFVRVLQVVSVCATQSTYKDDHVHMGTHSDGAPQTS